MCQRLRQEFFMAMFEMVGNKIIRLISFFSKIWGFCHEGIILYLKGFSIFDYLVCGTFEAILHNHIEMKMLMTFFSTDFFYLWLCMCCLLFVYHGGVNFFYLCCNHVMLIFFSVWLGRGWNELILFDCRLKNNIWIV